MKKTKVIVFKGMINPIPDIFSINMNSEDMVDRLKLLEQWNGFNACSFITANNKVISYGAGQIRKIIIK